jgi:hypothetical protein
LLKSWKSTICRSFLAAAIVVAGPVLGIAGLAGSASAGPAPALPPAALGGISCTSATFCMAVGGASATMSTQVAAEDWTGSAWHRLPIPKPGGVSNVGLSAVSCPSATECVAIGAGSASWLDGVSCASTTHCVAIGGTLFSNGSGAAFVDTLSGTTWTKTAQSGSAFKVGELNAVSCFSTTTRATSCALLGATTPISATQRPLSAFLTGSTWHVVFTV